MSYVIYKYISEDYYVVNDIYKRMEIIRLNNITKEFEEKKVLDNINYTFEKNQCYVLSGKSGIGKTTLLNIISGYIEADAGCVKFAEHVKVDYMFQDELLFSNLKVIENLYLKYYANHTCNGWDIDSFKEKIKDVMAQFQIEELMERKAELLSGGERQRIILANMVLSEANVLLMDEPVTKFDEENRKTIISLIEKCMPDRVIIIVSHDDLVFSRPIKKLTLKEGNIYEAE